MCVPESVETSPLSSSCPFSLYPDHTVCDPDAAQTRMKEALIIFANSKEIEAGWSLTLKQNLFSQPDGPSNSKQNMQMICSHFFCPVRLN